MSDAGGDALATLTEKERQARDEAMTRFQEAQRTADDATQQAQQLRQYRDDYAQRWTTNFQQGGTRELLHCYQTFMQRLDHAVAQQTTIAAQAVHRLNHHRELLLACELRLGAVRKLVERRQDQAAQQTQRAAQRLTDEMAQRMHNLTQAQRRAADSSWMP